MKVKTEKKSEGTKGLSYRALPNGRKTGIGVSSRGVVRIGKIRGEGSGWPGIVRPFIPKAFFPTLLVKEWERGEIRSYNDDKLPSCVGLQSVTRS